MQKRTLYYSIELNKLCLWLQLQIDKTNWQWDAQSFIKFDVLKKSVYTLHTINIIIYLPFGTKKNKRRRKTFFCRKTSLFAKNVCYYLFFSHLLYIKIELCRKLNVLLYYFYFCLLKKKEEKNIRKQDEKLKLLSVYLYICTI